MTTYKYLPLTDNQLTSIVSGLVEMTIPLGYTAEYAARYISQRIPGPPQRATRIQTLTKHFYKYPPDTRQVA